MSRRVGVLANDANAHARAKADARYLKQFDDDLKMVVASPQGRRFLSRLIFDTCQVMVSAEKPANAEIYMISGRRQVGESLLGTLEVIAPAETRQMVDEWFKDRFERRAEMERAGNTPESADGDDE